MLRSARGFSLVEVLVAIAISTFLMVSFTDLYTVGIRSYHGLQERSTIGLDAILVVDFLRDQIIAAGGGQIRAWQAIWVEDNCAARGPLPACSGSDRITVSTVTLPLQQCTITGPVSGNTWQVNFITPGACCLTPTGDQVPWSGKQIMLTLNDYYSSKYLSTLPTFVDTATCRVTLAAGQAAGGDSPPPTTPNMWTNAVMTMTSVETLYWDSATTGLIKYVDANNNNVIDPGDTSTVAVGIYDLQVALGFDCNPADGNIVASANGVADEWLYNAPSVAEAWGAGTFVAPATRAELLMVQAGVIIGAKTPNGINFAKPQILNGPQRSLAGYYLQPQLMQVAPRNSYVFQ